MVTPTALFLVGLILMITGARLLVRGASNVAYYFSISPLVVGLTIVAFGTSAPEIAVCSLASLRGESGIAIGNVVGSNIFNTLLPLGLAATISNLRVTKKVIYLDVPIMIGLSFLIWGLSFFGKIHRIVGFFLFAAIIFYLIWQWKRAKEENHQNKPPREIPKIWFEIFYFVLGILFLTVGSDQFVTSAVVMARMWGVSELMVGITIVAVGTSLPEVVTTFVALSKNEKDLAIGNIIGSNIFNLLGVLGIAAIVAPSGITIAKEAVYFDLPVMVATAIACFPIFLTGHRVSRSEGILFLFYYVFYITYLILQATKHAYLPLFTSAFFFFLLPLTIITLIIALIRYFKKEGSHDRKKGS